MNTLRNLLAITSAGEIVQHPHVRAASLERFAGVGMCSKCGEFTALDNPCCSALVWYEGDLVAPEPDDE
jgi:hypothetical protein